jgi:hypothetical protein
VCKYNTKFWILRAKIAAKLSLNIMSAKTADLGAKNHVAPRVASYFVVRHAAIYASIAQTTFPNTAENAAARIIFIYCCKQCQHVLLAR